MNKRKLNWIGCLLIVSQVALILFICQWLVTQYERKKSALTQEIAEQYLASQQQVIDSVLVKEVVQPVLVSTEFLSDTLTPNSATVIAIQINDSLEPESNQHVNPDRMIPRGQQDFLLRSLKLYIQEADSPHHSQVFAGLTADNADTAMLRNLFTSRLNQSGKHITFTWLADSIDQLSVVKKRNLFILRDSTGGLYPSASIGKINPLVIKEMSTEILFGIILMLLTGSAFAITFSSLKRQFALNRMRNDFVSNISHELKTPVSTVKVALEALTNRNLISDTAKTSEYLSMASEEIDRLEKLVGRVLDQSLLEESDSPMRWELINLNKLITEIVKGFQVRTPAGDATFLLEEQAYGLIVSGDRLYITSVLLNLIDNSLKYSSLPAEIKLTVGSGKGTALISVADKGPGIPKAYHNRVFEKFFRIPDKRQVKGYGLGLTFARQVVQKHGGSISIRNLEPGCAFTISLPLAT